VDAEFAHPFADGLHIPRVTEFKPLDPGCDSSPRRRVSERSHPFREGPSLPYLDHDYGNASASDPTER